MEEAGRSGPLVTAESLTVSSTQSSFFRTGVPDWHNHNSEKEIRVTCKGLTQAQAHTPIPAPPVQTLVHKSRQASA